MAKDNVQKKPKVVQTAKVQKAEKVGLLQRIKNFIKGVQAELRKVTWPTRKELINYTVVVVVMTILIALFIGLFDLFWKELFYRWL